MTADIQTGQPITTAAGKIERTLKELSKPDEDAGEMELTLATVAMAMERGLGAELDNRQESGEIDDFILKLTRWIALHRSDTAKELVVVEFPRLHPQRPLGAGTRLKYLDDAIASAGDAESPL
jgi:hypothetical protein